MAVRTIPPRRRPDVKWKKVGRSGILLDLKSGDFYEVDEVGVTIWKMLDGKTTVGAVSDKLARSYNAPLATIEKDVTKFVAELRKRKLIESDRG